MSANAGAIVRQGPVVLVVDDDPDILRILEMLLTRNGYAVRTAPSGEEALKILGSLVPAALITDVSMPGISGYDLCQIVKNEERLQEVPVVLLTAQGAPQDYKAGEEAGAVIYMVKPFKHERLLHVVRMLAPPSQPGP